MDMKFKTKKPIKIRVCKPGNKLNYENISIEAGRIITINTESSSIVVTSAYSEYVDNKPFSYSSQGPVVFFKNKPSSTSRKTLIEKFLELEEEGYIIRENKHAIL